MGPIGSERRGGGGGGRVGGGNGAETPALVVIFSIVDEPAVEGRSRIWPEE